MGGRTAAHFEVCLKAPRIEYARAGLGVSEHVTEFPFWGTRREPGDTHTVGETNGHVLSIQLTQFDDHAC